MRIAISGTACQGKTTLLNDFLKTYNTYDTPDTSYRQIIVDDKHSKETNVDTQWKILDFMSEQLTSYRADDNVIFDRCPLDNIVYSLWCHERGVEGFDREYIDKSIALFRETMKLLDIIFFIPVTRVATIEIEGKEQRETDAQYIKEIDNIFKAMYQQWLQPESTFFEKDDRAAIIEIFGSPQERMHMIKLYIDPDTGESIDAEGILNPEEMKDIEHQFRNSGDGYTDMNDVNRLMI